ncbi:hypothetical protein RF55_21190, partial [Lasius niger]
MATGGGQEQSEANIDPNVALIASHLMKTAPVSFTSIMTEKEITEKRDLVFGLISSDNLELLNDEDDPTNIERDVGTTISQDTSTIQDNVEQHNKELTDKVPDI